MVVEVQARPKIEYDDRVDWDKLPYSIQVDPERWANTLHFLGMDDRHINRQVMFLDPKSRPIDLVGRSVMGEHYNRQGRTHIYTRSALVNYSLPMDHAYRQAVLLNATLNHDTDEADFHDISDNMKRSWGIDLGQAESASRQDFAAHLADETFRQTVAKVSNNLTRFVHHESQHAADWNNMYMSWPTLINEIIHSWVKEKPLLYVLFYELSVIERRARKAERELAKYPSFGKIITFTPKTAEGDIAKIIAA